MKSHLHNSLATHYMVRFESNDENTWRLFSSRHDLHAGAAPCRRLSGVCETWCVLTPLQILALRDAVRAEAHEVRLSVTISPCLDGVQVTLADVEDELMLLQSLPDPTSLCSRLLPVLTAASFTPTACHSAEDKLKGLNALVSFIRAGFSPPKFTRQVYDVLHMHLGHIAHYDRSGFYDTWFADTSAQRRWLHFRAGYEPRGMPSSCWVDVERMLKTWLFDPAALAAFCASTTRAQLPLF